MGKKIFRVCFALLLSCLVFMLLFSSVSGAQSTNDETLQSKIGLQRQVTRNTLDVTVLIFLSEQYKFWDSNIRNEVVVSMAANLTEPVPTPYVISTMVPFSLSEVADLPSGAYYTYGFWGYPPIGTLSIHITTNVSSFSIKLKGYVSGNSVFWRNVAEMPLFPFSLKVTSPIGDISSYNIVLVPPSSSRVLRVYSRFFPELHYREIIMEGQRCLLLSETYPRLPFVVLYEPETWETYALIVMFATILMVFAVPYVLRSEKIRTVASSVVSKFRKSSSLRMMAVFRRLYTEIRKTDSSKLLTAYILCALLMTSVSYAAGPDPRLKVYVLASTQENARTISSFVYSEAGAVAITNFDEMSEFETLTNLGTFSAVIIGDFFPPEEKLVKDYIYPALDRMSRYYKSIIILKNYAFDIFSSEIQGRYADKTTVVQDLDALRPVLLKIPRRVNALGLNVSPETYSGVSAFVGLCSFVIFFFGVAFLACKLIEVGKKPGVGGFPEAIAYAVFVFIFTQTIYIVCSVLLAMPLGLHTGSPKVTAVGFLGFGGGSRPRMLAGLIGFLFGSLVPLKEGLKLDRMGILSFLVVGFFVIIDPLTSGIVFYEFILLYAAGSGSAFRTVSMTMSYVRDFLSTIGDAFGAWVSPIYGTSTGIILYYAGTMPLCLLPKLKRSTATVMLLSCAFFVANGGIRVADMTPWKSVASLVPGIMASLVFAVFFRLISHLEMIVRKNIGKREAA